MFNDIKEAKSDEFSEKFQSGGGGVIYVADFGNFKHL